MTILFNRYLYHHLFLITGMFEHNLLIALHISFKPGFYFVVIGSISDLVEVLPDLRP